ncbi:anaerobic ribonucleotide reductase-activating protein [uncultured Roseburia sp.]|uniref:Anaerobic ribonucleoside-triphosphate reductase-activating protein n=1 Tax=Brotonthovivens ammoniilytica TaxID=2981725 RepID=A0ABT2TJJ1_9FIRM|nr:anaerobic ribonucleoside-triphosphate reductase activating protein [Brotonthovivens ammoniilytica]MCU6762360.1 anaerobic ribonucleoside-triphosphate reductase activating protein [Brotonthovivens ammoniilytica]SCI69327.1 anaerobic ribonucleotide reductase-activating protein [uncultured Roseburia sp.]
MNYAAIKKCDIANGPGVRVTLFVSGCTHHCRECFQPETWDFKYGNRFDETVEQGILEALAPDYIQGLTLLGGEPFEPANQRALVPFLHKVRERYPDKDIWCFSGYVLEELTGMQEGTGRARCEVTDEMLSLIDVLVDGEFELEQKDISLQFRGSSNQRLIQVKESLEKKEIIWWSGGK